MSTKAQNGKSRMVYFRCPHDTYEDFRLWAIDKNTSIAALIYGAMTGWLNAQGTPPPDPEIAKRDYEAAIARIRAGEQRGYDILLESALTKLDDETLALIESLG